MIESNEHQITKQKRNPFAPSPAFIGVSWFVLIVGLATFIIGLINAEMNLSEKGFYFTLLLFGLFAVVSVQKSVRDKLEEIPVSEIYYGICWFASIVSVLLLVIGLWNSNMTLSEKGFYGVTFILSLFAAIAVQKNTRDKILAEQIAQR